MRLDHTEIIIVLDRSGSMDGIRDDTIGGFNRFITDQKAADGVGYVTLVQFDDRYEMNYQGALLQTVPALDRAHYEPSGSTALLEAIGRTIEEQGARFSRMHASDRPGKVVFVIITDGMENASNRTIWFPEKISALIDRQRSKYAWQFIYLGANHDAIVSAANFHIPLGSAMTYTAGARGIATAFSNASMSTTSYRSGATGQAVFSDTQRTEQGNANLADLGKSSSGDSSKPVSSGE